MINIDAFNKPSNNVIHQENDKLSGHKPIDFVRAAQPIVLIDEPQNVEGEQAKKAIESLNPLFTLRYSATHRNVYNLAYRLDPVRAYDLKLVKRIEIDSVLEDPDFNKPFIRVEKISSTKTQVSAKLTIDVQQRSGPARKPVTISQNLRGQWKNANLYESSGHRTAYDGYVLDGIDVGMQTVTFSNGVTLQAGAEHGARADDLMRVQIRQTILKHFIKERELAERASGERVKVLSLFFIDRVSSYADEPTQENPRGGFVRRVFDEEYVAVARRAGMDLAALPPPEKVRSAYFAQDRKGKAKDTSGDTQADDDAYQDFAERLQSEIEQECGVSFAGRVQNARERRKVALKKGWQLDDHFLQLWERIKHKTRYRVEYATEDLIVACVDAIKGLPPITAPRITAITTEMEMSNEGIGVGKLRSVKSVEVAADKIALPDMVSYLVRETELTRDTILTILFRSGRLADGVLNPQEFLDGALRAIRFALDRIIIQGIKYERIAGQSYEMMLFHAHELEGYLSKMINVSHSIHDCIMFDSEVEKQFALDLDSRPDIKLFVKLPAWFKVETPIGTYNPDWAIVKQAEGEEEKLYLVRETKSLPTPQQLRDREYLKIRCGRAHFDTLGVDFKTAVRASDV